MRICLQAVQQVRTGAAHRFFKILPGIYDENDQDSDFLEGVVLGLRRLRRNKWKAQDPVKFLVRNGLWQVRYRRYRAMKRRLLITCQCGKRLRMSQKPCHGTMADRQVRSRLMPVGGSYQLMQAEAERIQEMIGWKSQQPLAESQ
jgi:hypothetical protein